MEKRQDKKKIIVISAVNFFEGGPLTILKDNLKYANSVLSNDYKVIVLVHKKTLFASEYYDKIIFYEFPKSRESYFNRLYLEYFYFNKLSKKWNPYLWFSLHDMTPNVCADIRAVYCHNPTPFKKKSIKDLFFQPTIFFFSLFYKLLYQINIRKNNFVVVQQIWLKKAFVSLFELQDNKVLVCYPEANEKIDFSEIKRLNNLAQKKESFTFFYPALARPFKNFEVIGEAVKMLKKQGVDNFQVIITIKGNENNYAKHILKKYGQFNNIKLVGLLDFQEVVNNYKTADALLFSSTLETWGLPITEFKSFNKPIILSRLPYAFETMGEYEKACFFDPNCANDLAEKMASLIYGNLLFDKTSKIDEKVLTGWSELYNKLLQNKMYASS